MQVFTEIAQLRDFLDLLNSGAKSVGFVPTMGALHEGHLSLIRYSLRDCDHTIASIFVNPEQFNNPDDLRHYPRTLEDDLNMLKEIGCDAVFTPSVEEMYPEQPTGKFNFGHLDKVMEGKHRPGHFNGVAIVVKRLFEIVKPDRAFFGQKDFQQLAIIKAMVKMLKLPIEIIACPIIREQDGLAMSSRNVRLTKDERELAPVIYKSLTSIKDGFTRLTLEEIHHLISQRINSISGMKLEYFEIVDPLTLLPLTSKDASPHCIACIALFLGEVRLIDNMMLN